MSSRACWVAVRRRSSTVTLPRLQQLCDHLATVSGLPIVPQQAPWPTIWRELRGDDVDQDESDGDRTISRQRWLRASERSRMVRGVWRYRSRYLILVRPGRPRRVDIQAGAPFSMAVQNLAPNSRTGPSHSEMIGTTACPQAAPERAPPQAARGCRSALNTPLPGPSEHEGHHRSCPRARQGTGPPLRGPQTRCSPARPQPGRSDAPPPLGRRPLGHFQHGGEAGLRPG